VIYEPSLLAVIVFFVFVALTLSISFYFAAKTRSAQSYFAARNGTTEHKSNARPSRANQ
jgi:Na+(H+)/acetate symporter ActP